MYVLQLLQRTGRSVRRRRNRDSAVIRAHLRRLTGVKRGRRHSDFMTRNNDRSDQQRGNQQQLQHHNRR